MGGAVMDRFRTALPAALYALLFGLLIAPYFGLIRSSEFVPFLPPEIQIMAIFVLSAVFVAAPSTYLAIATSRLPGLDPYKLILFPFFFGLLSLISVVFWFLSKELGTVVSLILLASVPFGIHALRGAKKDMSFWRPIAVQILVSITFAVSAFDRGWSLDGLRLIAHRYWVSIDSALPFIFARHLVSDRAALLNNFGGGGQGNSADRPPLMAGAALHLQGFASTFWEVTVFLSVAFVANSIWIIGLWLVLREFKISEKLILWNVLLVALSGMTFVNTVYTWPKLLGAGFSLCALALAMSSKSKNVWAHALFGSFFALAMLSHGSAVFFLAPIVVLWVSRVGIRSIRNTSALGLSAAILYAPWVIYQNLIDPPGDRLLKWHLAGVIPESNEPFVEALIRRYGALDLVQVIQNKLNNVLALMGFSPDSPSMASSQPMWTDLSLSGLRHLQSISLLPALGLSLLPLLKYLFFETRKKPKTQICFYGWVFWQRFSMLLWNLATQTWQQHGFTPRHMRRTLFCLPAQTS